MANTFKSTTSTAVGVTPATIYTCPSATQTTVIGLTVANIVTSQILISVQLDKNGGDNVYLVKDAPVPAGSAIVPIGGDQKVVLETDDVLKVTSDTATSADVALSYLEIS